MTTQKKVETLKSSQVEDHCKNPQNFIPKEYLTTLKSLEEIPSYQQLGYSLKSLCKIMQTALLAEIQFPNYTEHSKWDLYNLLGLIRGMIPKDEMELLDKINDSVMPESKRK
jgi:hypothetical protein